MTEFFDPAYVLDLSDKMTCARIRRAKAGESFPVGVRVPGQEGTPSLPATGTRSKSGESFDVRLTTDEGYQDFGWHYQDVLLLISQHEEE